MPLAEDDLILANMNRQFSGTEPEQEIMGVECDPVRGLGGIRPGVAKSQNMLPLATMPAGAAGLAEQRGFQLPDWRLRLL